MGKKGRDSNGQSNTLKVKFCTTQPWLQGIYEDLHPLTVSDESLKHQTRQQGIVLH